MGTVTQGGAVISPLSWEEIITWAKQMYAEDVLEWVEIPSKNKRKSFHPVVTRQLILLDYELLLIRQLSQEYAWELSQDDPMRKCPTDAEMSEEDMIANGNAMEAAFIAMMGLAPSIVENS